jgi:hypothetical protein
MMRDIDQIVASVQQQIPEVIVSQLQKKFVGDDDGIWWFILPGVSQDIQLESPSGSCPFLVETDEQSSHEARIAQTVEQAVGMIVSFLTPMRRASTASISVIDPKND